ncbi:hypothetical protein [Bradyrhizobium sp. 5.13L]
MTDSDSDLREIAAILAAAHQRLSERKSSQKTRCSAKTLLDCGERSEGDVAHKAKEANP